MVGTIFDHNLEKNPANYAPLTPLSFLERAAYVYPQRVSVIHGTQRYTWGETYARCRRLASALTKRGIAVGQTVAAMLPNTPPLYEAHFGVAMAGAVLNTLNTRLDAEAIAFMLDHGEARLLITDKEFATTVEAALKLVKRKITVVDAEDPKFSGGKRLGDTTYEQLLAEGDPAFAWRWPTDEWEAISLNYTSGTTGNPKGVVYHHRGAYLNALGNILVWGMRQHPVYLWTLPMFHCNGWCFPWTVTALAGTHVCLRRVEAAAIYEAIERHGATMGEIFFRGNIVMKGYLKNPQATGEAFAGGWFHSGDLAVAHPDGYIEIKDRSKDIIISGGENISTIEVEDVLYRHPAVLEAAVVAKPDPNWGETPCAFVTLKDGTQAEAAEIIAFCRERMARFKAPRH